MLLFEKPNLKRLVSLDLVAIILSIIILTAALTYGACVILGIVSGYDSGSKITFLDIVDAMAQIATAFAFGFAVYQFRINGEKERQSIIATEAKLLTSRMATVADNAKSNTKYTINDINNFVGLMSNLGADFMGLYEALTDDIHKAMVRMRWQDMHYNHLSKTLSSFTIDSLFENENLEKDFKSYSFIDSRLDTSVQSKPEIYQEYFFVKKVLSEMSIGDEIIKKFDSLFLFNAYYFDDKITKDLMYGLLSRLDIKVRAPLLAVIKEKQSF